ncbi:glycosyltransferase [Acinetobacter indicus]|uniref:glycosyltransferase n=1 Tax=Acinetobacter indicus TaxID=756892 RepID=UPI000CEC7A06|nr:glycosyltransferase [Acinetobacter indicus]
MKNLVILTNSFPYEGGEQFIESEVHYWAKTGFDNVYILPEISPTQVVRYFPVGLTILQRLEVSSYSKIFILLFVILYSLFWKEIFYLIKSNSLNITNVVNAVKAIFGTKVREKQLKHSLKNIGGDILIYSYWNDMDCYAAIELKKKGLFKKVVSRCHGYDCYEVRRKNSYMPLKRQYQYIIDRVFLLSELAKKYYSNTYAYPEDSLDMASLGVFLPEKTLAYSKIEGVLRVLSISNCIQLKRVDKIIDALSVFSKDNHIEVHWTHIGNGVLLEKLKQQAKDIELIGENTLFKYNFVGFLPNTEVKQLLSRQNFDLFVNASESEGVPVSIMEAMSYSIPVIAPDVGGISDIVNDSTGKLLSSNPSIKEIAGAIQEIYYSSSYSNYRENAFLMVKENYNADSNYINFIKKLSQIPNE